MNSREWQTQGSHYHSSGLQNKERNNIIRDQGELEPWKAGCWEGWPSVSVPIKGKQVGARGQGSLSHPSVSPIIAQAPWGSENKPRQWRKQRVTANILWSYDWRQESGWLHFWKVRENNLIFNNPQEIISNEEDEVVWDEIKCKV